MRGSPLLYAILAFVCIGLLGIPIQRLTGATSAEPAPVAPERSEPAAAAKVPIVLEFTTVPRAARVKHLGKIIWSSDQPEMKAEAEFDLPWPEEGVDLLFEVTWPDDAPLSAARVTITSPEGEEQIRSIWGQGQATEVFTFR